jgi:hypothetical protein
MWMRHPEGRGAMRRSGVLLGLAFVVCFSSVAWGMYNPVQGRFMQRDPVEHEDGMNPYEYLRSQPITNSDPEGTVVAVFKGWSKKKMKVSHEVVLAIDRMNKGLQDSDAYEATEAGLEKAKTAVKASIRDRSRPGCPEPVYIAGFSAGSRAAQVLALELSEMKEDLWSTGNKKGKFTLPILIFFDYNWGAQYFDQEKFDIFHNWGVGKPLKPDVGYKVPTDVSLVFHWVSVGKMTEPREFREQAKPITAFTEEVYTDWNKAHDVGQLSKDHGGLVGLANTSGFFAWEKMPGDFRGLPLPYDGDHYQLGASSAVGTMMGWLIRQHYRAFGPRKPNALP